MKSQDLKEVENATYELGTLTASLSCKYIVFYRKILKIKMTHYFLTLLASCEQLAKHK